MDNKKDHITDLLIEKITGSIAADDEAMIDHLIATDADVHAEWVAVSQKFSDPSAQKYLSELDSPAQWQHIQYKLNTGRNKVIRLKWLSAAAVLLLSASAFFYVKDKPRSAGQQIVVNKPYGVELTVSNGQTVNLSAKGGVINVGHLKLSNKQKTLSYTPTQDHTVNWMTLAVPVKLDYKVTLADGTEVWLNAASSLKFPSAFPGKTRDVYLEGEGYFKVAKNKECPFIVHTGNADVKVLGTVFNIDAYHPEAMTTSLVEGKVMLTAGKQTHYLVPGHQAVLNNALFNDQLFDEQRELAWMTGEEYFNNMPLSAIADILQRWYDVKLIADEPSLADRRLSGVIFKNRPLSFFLNSLETSSGIKTVVKNNTVHIFR